MTRIILEVPKITIQTYSLASMALILTRTTLIAFGPTFYGLAVAFSTRFACSLTRIILEVPNSAIHTLALAFMALILASETRSAFALTFYSL